MKPNRTIQIKALLLLIVFSLNTVMSFACSLGLEMWYNRGHHSENKKTGTSRHCCEKSKNASDTKNNQQPPVEKDDCCTNSVINFQLMAKCISQIDINFTAPVSYFKDKVIESALSLERSIAAVEIKWAEIRTHLLPPPDIRVSIRSFQI